MMIYILFGLLGLYFVLFASAYWTNKKRVKKLETLLN